MTRTRLLLPILLGAPAAFGQGFFVGDNGATPAMMGGAGVAYPEDLATAIYNPAGLVRVKDGAQGSLAIVSFTHGTYDRAPDANSSGQPYPTTELEKTTYIGGPFLAIADNLGTEKLRFAFSSNLEFGSKLDFDQNGVQRYMMKEVFLYVMNQNFSASYAWNDEWSIGGALIYSIANVTEEIDLDLVNLLDPNALPSEKPENRIPTSVELEDNGFGWNVGVLYDTDRLRLGFLYHSAITQKLDGTVTTDLTRIPQAVKDLLGVQGNSLALGATMDLKLPQYARLGASFKPKDDWWLAGEFFWIDWSTLQAFDIKLDPNPVNVTSYVIPRYWDDGYSFKIGADYRRNERNRFRAGGFWVKAPTKRQYIQLDIPDNDRFGITFGWAHDFKGPLGFDIAYIHQFVKSWHIEDSRQKPPVNGDVEVNFGTLLLGLRYDF